MAGLTHAEMTTLLSALVSPDPEQRDDACGTVTDWVRAFDRHQVRTVATVITTMAVGESVPVCRESQLHALCELADTGHLTHECYEPLLDLAADTLLPGEREYVEALRETAHVRATAHVHATAQLTETARDLNEYVVCLDRILSRLGTGAYPDSILTDYLVARRVPQRLARLRETVFDALEAVVGVDEAEHVAEESYVYQDPPA